MASSLKAGSCHAVRHRQKPLFCCTVIPPTKAIFCRHDYFCIKIIIIIFRFPPPWWKQRLFFYSWLSWKTGFACRAGLPPSARHWWSRRVGIIDGWRNGINGHQRCAGNQGINRWIAVRPLDWMANNRYPIPGLNRGNTFVTALGFDIFTNDYHDIETLPWQR